MSHYKYVNLRNKIVVFECDAINIIAADNKMARETGLNPTSSHIACRITEKPSWLNVAKLLGICVRQSIGNVLSRIKRKLKLKKPAAT